MKVIFTLVDTHFATKKWDLRREFINILPEIARVALRYEKRDDKRNLVIVLLCPCLTEDPSLEIENSILVSPFLGIEDERCYKVHTVKKTPPFRNPGKGKEARDKKEFLKHFKQTIERAISKK